MTDVPPRTAPNDVPTGEPAKTAPTSDPPKTSSWGTALLTAVFGLIGVVAGGFLQYYFSSSLETEKQRMQIQLSAYADFAKAQAAWQRAGAETDDAKRKEAIRDSSLRIRDAAFRIVVFSPPEVVRALAAFVQQSGDREECNTTDTDIALYQIVRRQNTRQVSESDHDVSNQDVAMALFGCKLK